MVLEKRLRSDTLKIIAMVCMLIDHIGAGILEQIYMTTADIDLAQKIRDIDLVFRGVGRIALPIFAYQIAVGMIYTKSKIKYIRRLAIFSVVSEIPFNLIACRKLFDFSHQNVMITLLLGALAIWGIEWFSKESKWKRAIFNTTLVTVLSIVAELLHTDYGAKGVIIVAVIYIIKTESDYANSADGITLMAAIFMVEVFVITYLRTKNIHSTMSYCSSEIYALFAFPIIYMDSGVRKGGKVLKWIGYWFYPAHLMIVYIVSRLLVG